VYASKKIDLQELEALYKKGFIDLFYGDESHVSSEGYVPYGWQFADEEVAIYTEKSYKINIFGLISRNNQCHWAISEQNINSEFIIENLEDLSFKIKKQTFVVLDNASVHQSKAFQQRLKFWQTRGLHIFFLPPYSPELNIAETMWRILKGKWIRPQDYVEKDTLFYAVNRCMANIGKEIKINFCDYYNAN
jgi:transposase